MRSIKVVHSCIPCAIVYIFSNRYPSTGLCRFIRSYRDAEGAIHKESGINQVSKIRYVLA